MEADKTKCLAGEEEAGIMDIFIIGGRGKVDGRQTKVVVVTSQRRRSAIPELRSNWSTLPPSIINIDENDTFIHERQVRPRRKSKEIYWDAASRRQPFLRRSYIKQSLQANSDARRADAREIPVSRSIRYSLRECRSTQIFLFETRLDSPLSLSFVLTSAFSFSLFRFSLFLLAFPFHRMNEK